MKKIFSWTNVRKFGVSKFVQSSFVWIAIVPLIAKVLSKMNSLLVIPIGDEKYVFVLELPFSWQLFFFSAISFSLATIIYFVWCPRIIKEHYNATHFLEEGKTLTQLREYAEEIDMDVSIQERKTSMMEYGLRKAQTFQQWGGIPPSENQPITEYEKLINDTKTLFWTVFDEANKSKYMAMYISMLLYIIGSILFFIVILKNIWFAFYTMLQIY